MTNRKTIRRLLSLAAPDLPGDPHLSARIAARAIWAHETIARLEAAQKRADDAWMALIAELPEDEDGEGNESPPAPPEQAEVDALWEVVNAVVKEDRWPAHLYFGGV